MILAADVADLRRFLQHLLEILCWSRIAKAAYRKEAKDQKAQSFLEKSLRLCFFVPLR